LSGEFVSCLQQLLAQSAFCVHRWKQVPLALPVLAQIAPPQQSMSGGPQDCPIWAQMPGLQQVIPCVKPPQGWSVGGVR
jgi:hypothetical protein